MKKIIPYIIALGIGASSLTSCATSSPLMSCLPEDNIDRAMRVLDIDNEKMLYRTLPDNYIASRMDKDKLNILAGIYTGTIKAIPTEGGYLFDGFYSEIRNPDSMRRVLKDADKNRDKIITSEEVSSLVKKVLE